MTPQNFSMPLQSLAFALHSHSLARKVKIKICTLQLNTESFRMQSQIHLKTINGQKYQSFDHLWNALPQIATYC